MKKLQSVSILFIFKSNEEDVLYFKYKISPFSTLSSISVGLDNEMTLDKKEDASHNYKVKPKQLNEYKNRRHKNIEEKGNNSS